MSEIILATEKGVRVIGAAGTDSVEGALFTNVVLGDGCLWALVGPAAGQGRELVRINGTAESVATVEGPHALCLLASGADVFVGTDEAHLLRLGDGRLERVESFEEAPTHEEWHTPWGGPPATRSMAADRGRLYVNVHVGGILRTDDRGETWSSTLDLHDDVHQVSIDSKGTVWAATGHSALAESHDGGDSWSYHREGLHAAYLRSVVPLPDGVLVGASSGPRAKDGAVYRFDSDGFHLCENGLPSRFEGNLDTYRTASAGDTVAVAGRDGRLYVSEDAGRTWTDVAGDLPKVNAVVIR